MNAALRTGAGMIPSPTAMRSVAASAVAVWAIPPPLKQSSHSHASAKPAASAARACATRSSGGSSGRMTMPRSIGTQRCHLRALSAD